MVTRYKTSADYELDEILDAVEESYGNGIFYYEDSEVSESGEPVIRKIVIKSMVTLGEDNE